MNLILGDEYAFASGVGGVGICKMKVVQMYGSACDKPRDVSNMVKDCTYLEVEAG